MNEQNQSKPPSAKRIVSVLAWLFIVGAAGSLSASIWGLAVVALALIACVVAVVHKPTRDKVPLKWSVSLALGFAAAAYTGGSIQYAAYQERAAAEQKEERFQSALADVNKFIEQKRYADAIKSFESALAIRKPTAVEAKPLFAVYLGNVLDNIDAGKYREAQLVAKRALELWPNESATMNDRPLLPKQLAQQVDALIRIDTALAMDANKRPEQVVTEVSTALEVINSLDTVWNAEKIITAAERRLAELAPVVADTSLAAAEQQIKAQEFEKAIESASRASGLYDVSGDTAKKQRAQSLVATATKEVEAAKRAAQEAAWAKDKESAMLVACHDFIRRKLSPKKPDFNSRPGEYEIVFEGDRTFRVHVKYDIGDMKPEHFGKCKLRVDTDDQNVSLLELVTF